MKHFVKFLFVLMALVMAVPPAWADETVTVCEGTTTNAYVPYCSELAMSSSSKFTSQMIYLPTNLDGLPVGATIKAITFHAYLSVPSTIYDRRFFVNIGETDLTAVTEATLNNRSLVSNQVFGGDYGATASNSGSDLTFTFTSGYIWNGGNLAIELYCASTSNSNDQSFYWYGVSAPSASSGFHRVNNKGTNQNYLQAFLPKMTITYEGGTVVTNPVVEISPEELTINDSGSGNTLAITGSDITGSINASLANNSDWTLSPETFPNTGGDVAVTYTGRALSASNTVTASAASDNTVTASATVNYLADLYIVTDNGVTGQWDFNNGTMMDYSDGVYTAVFNAEQSNTYILFARKLGSGVNWETRYVFGPSSNGDWWMQGESASGAIDLNDDDPIYFPDSGSYTITINANDNTLTVTKYVQPEYAVTVNPDGGTLNFGDVQYNQSSRTSTIIVNNIGLQPVTPSLSALTAPFSTDYTANELAPGASTTINITFTPTEEGPATGTAVLSFGNGIADRNYTLAGNGIRYGENDHSAIYDKTYQWTDSLNNPRTSNLLETATDPDQIIAMLREIYVNQDIPGNKVRGYTEDGTPESLMINGNNAFEVNYSAVGQLNSSEQYVDQYGWGIPTSKPLLSRTAGSSTYKYFDPTEYTPKEEGLTLIMLELKDGANNSGVSSYYSFGSSSLSLREKIANTIKSARIITTYKKSGSGEEAGTLFKIDADKLNRFFFLAKGQLRIIDHGQAYESDWTNSKVHPYPSLKGSSTFTDNTFNESSGGAVLAPFEHMFEQFSPNQANSGSSAMTDVYQELVNMASYEVIHDCVSIPFVGGNHEFNMYGVDSESEDCQDVRDMMFFVPDYRMKFWKASAYAFGENARDPSSAEKFVNYNQDHRPTLGLYVIRQNEITGEQHADADVYDLHLSWQSNLLDFLPDAEGMYQLFRVTINDDGTKEYTWVATLDPNETTYIDQIAMQENGQVVTYVVQGQDKTQFLSLQMSNEESYIIPGLDKSEIFNLSLKTEDYSRFDPDQQVNYYANQLKVSNNVGTNIKGSYLGNGAKFTFYRIPANDETRRTVIFEAVSNGNGTLSITSSNQRESGLYHDWIYMPNPTTVTYTVDASDNVTFNNFNLYDNFYESVASNDHPSLYVYEAELAASTTIADTDPATDVAHSNQIAVFVHKTDMNILGYSEQQVIDDTDHSLATGQRPVTEEVKYSSKTEILRYDAYRWKQYEDNHAVIIDFASSRRDEQTGAISIEQDFAPNGIAGNQAGLYTISMDGENQSENNVAVELSHPVWATFMDKVVENEWGMYTYAPVVETFTTRSDYNTYGAPVQQTGVAKIHSDVVYAEMSSDQNGKGGQPWMEGSKKFTHYTVLLDIDQLLIPVSTSDMLKDYDLYKVRVWRQVKYDLLNEIDYPEQYASKNRNERLANKVTINGEEYGEFLMEELNYDKFSRATVLDANQADGNVLGNSEVTDFYPNWTKSSNEVMATFGAQKLRENDDETGEMITSLPMKFIVRAYYTRSANIDQTTPSGHRAPMRGVDVARDGKYYVAEFQFDYTLDENNPPITSVKGIYTDRVVTGETYYNIMGQSSSEPFEGVNIVVTRYNDGTTTTAKVIK